MSRTLLKNDDTLMEFRRTWRFLTGAGLGSLITFWMLSFDEIKIEFQRKKSVMFEGVKNPPEELWHSAVV